jgi:quinol monooxygenase YgiN
MRALLLAFLLALPGFQANAQGSQGLVVMIVELELDPARVDEFKAAAKEIGEASVLTEPGCRAYNVIFEKDNPARARLFEVYDSADALKAHVETAHFKKYVETTKDIIKSRKRIEHVSFSLNAKGK